MNYIKGKNLITEEEFITCPYCGNDSKKWRYLHWKHLKLSHNKKLDDVREEFPNHPTMTKLFDDDRLEGAIKSAQTHNQKKKVKCIYCDEIIWVRKNEGNKQACSDCLEKGLENPDGRTKVEAQQNRVKTFQKKYGVDNPQQVDEFKEKTSKTFDIEHGGRGFGSKVLAKKTRDVIKERYGAENIMQTEEGMWRLINSFKQKYGKEITNPLHILEIKNKVSGSLKDYFAKNSHHTKGKTYIEMYGDDAAKKLIELRREAGAKGHEMAPQTSKPQLELYELVKEIFSNAKLEFGQNLSYNDERYYYFLDIAIPEFKICIEYDGSYWHDEESDKFRDKVLSSFGWKVLRYIDRIPLLKELKEDINKLL